MTQLIAYHGKAEIKEKYVQRMKAHIAADELIHGTGWEDGKGCAVGCTLNRYDHAGYETELGIPRILARLEDGIFESLANGSAQKWPLQFLEAVPVGADLSLVWPEFAVWLLSDAEFGVLQFAKTERSRKAIEAVVEMYGKWVETGKNPATYDDWRKLRAAAAAAAASAAADAYSRTYKKKIQDCNLDARWRKMRAFALRWWECHLGRTLKSLLTNYGLTRCGMYSWQLEVR